MSRFLCLALLILHLFAHLWWVGGCQKAAERLRAKLNVSSCPFLPHLQHYWAIASQGCPCDAVSKWGNAACSYANCACVLVWSAGIPDPILGYKWLWQAPAVEAVQKHQAGVGKSSILGCLNGWIRSVWLNPVHLWKCLCEPENYCSISGMACWLFPLKHLNDFEPRCLNSRLPA